MHILCAQIMERNISTMYTIYYTLDKKKSNAHSLKEKQIEQNRTNEWADKTTITYLWLVSFATWMMSTSTLYWKFTAEAKLKTTTSIKQDTKQCNKYQRKWDGNEWRRRRQQLNSLSKAISLSITCIYEAHLQFALKTFCTFNNIPNTFCSLNAILILIWAEFRHRFKPKKR